METFIATTDESLKTQLETFCSNIDTYTTQLGLSTTKVDELKKCSVFYSFVFSKMVIYHDYSKGLTEYKDLLKTGKGGGTVLGPFPSLPALGTVPALPAGPDVRSLFAGLIQDAKRSANFTADVARNLGVLKNTTPFDPQAGTPTFKVGFSSGGHPNLIWVKGEYQGVEIWKDSSDEQGWKKLDKDFRPDFIDKTDLPPVGKSIVWKYKMIYLYQDEVAGHWSLEHSVTVTGQV